MDVQLTVGALLVSSLVVVPLGAQGHSGGSHGSPHAQGAGSHGAAHPPQGPKDPNPGAGHRQAAGRPDDAGAQGDGHGQGSHGHMTVSQRLAAQPQLSARLQALLPSGMTVDQAATGFKNLGQFVATVNVSKNLGIPFDQLKGQLTGASPKSLGQAIHLLKPGADADAEVDRAQIEARNMTQGR